MDSTNGTIGADGGSFTNALLMAEPRVEVQLVLGLGQALLWFLYMPWFAQHVVKPYIDRSSFREQWIQLHQMIYHSSGVKLSREGSYDLSCWTVPMITQHGIGGLLTVPLLLNIFSPEVNVALACHGALTEFGFEFQDLFYRLWQRKYGTESQKTANNPTILKLIIAHHMVGLSLIIPLNIIARNSRSYHEAGLLLQGASFISLFAQQYGFTLDMAQEKGARTMRTISRAVMCICLYTRLFRYLPLQYFLNMELREMGYHKMANVGVFTGLGLSFFNLVVISGAWKRVKKFANVEDVMASAQKRKAQAAAQPESEPLISSKKDK